MKAEVHGKVDPASTLPGDRMEDTLTDAVFSTLTYLRPEVLASVLGQVLPAAIDPSELLEPVVRFWPSLPSGTEPDLMITVAGWIVVVEAKYGSGFSTGPDPGDHQLVREWADAWPVAKTQQLRGPIVVAVTSDPARPPDIDLAAGSITTLPEYTEAELDGTDPVQWLSWQMIATCIDEATPDLTRPEQTMIEDLFAFMERRGVRRMFEPFNPEDYWLIASANRVATKRVLPAIATFADELLGHLDGEMTWGGGDQGVWHFRSLARSNPSDWPLNYVMLPFWPVGWPQRMGHQAVLSATFNLRDTRLEVGWLQSANGIGSAKQDWGPLVAGLAGAFQSLGEDYVVAFSTSDYSHRPAWRQAPDCDAEWLGVELASYKTIRLVRDIPIEDVVSSRAVADMLLEDREAIDNRPAIVESLRAANLLQAPES